MLSWAKQILAAPVFEDEDQTRTAALLNAILLTCLGGAGVLFISTLLIQREIGLIGPIMLVVILGLRFLLRRGYVQLVSLWLSTALLVIITYNNLGFGGLHNVAVTGYFLVVIIAGLLLGGRATIAFGSLSILATLGLFYAEASGFTPVSGLERTGLSQWVILSVVLGIAALLLRFAVNSLKQVLERARRDEQALEATLNALPDLLFELDRYGRICDFRAPQPELLHAPPEEFLGQMVSQVLPKEAASAIIDAISQAAETGQHSGMTYPLEMPDSIRWFELSIVAKDDPQAPDGHFIALARDVTKRVQAEKELKKYRDHLEELVDERKAELTKAVAEAEQLNQQLQQEIAERILLEEAMRESREHFRALIENSTDLIGIIGEDGTIRYQSPSSQRTLGYELEELIGQNIFSFIPSEDATYQGQAVRNALKQPDESLSFEGRFRHKKGHWINIETTIRHIPMLNGIVYNSRDVTVRKRAEEALRESEERYRRVNEGIRDVIYASDIEGKLTFISGAVEELLGSPPEALLDKKLLEAKAISHLPSEVIRQISDEFRQALKSKQKAIEYKLSSEINGELRFFECKERIEYDEKGNFIGTSGVMRDITERVRAEEALEKLNEDLKRRARELAALNNAGRAITSTLNQAEVLELVIAEVKELLGVESASVLLCDFPRGELVFAAVGDQTTNELIGARMPMTAGVAGWVVREKQPALVNDVSGDPRFYNQIDALTGYETRSLIAAPLVIGEVVIGVVEALNPGTWPEAPPGRVEGRSRRDSHHSQDGRFTGRDLEVLEMMASSAAIAIQNAQLYQGEREQRQLAETLREVGARMTATLDIEAVLDHLLEQVSRVVPNDMSNVMLIENQDRNPIARVVRWRGYPQNGDSLDHSATEGATVMYSLQLDHTTIRRRMFEAGQPVAIPDVRADPNWTHVPEEMEWLRSYVGAPLCIRGNTIGFLNVGSVTPGFFDQLHARRLQAFADQVAIALENARLFSLVSRERERLALLYRLGQELSSSLDVRAVARWALDGLCAVTGATRGIVLVRDPGDGGLRTVATSGYDLEPARVPSRELSIWTVGEERLADWVATHHQTALLDDIAQDERWVATPGVDDIVRSTLSAPLLSADALVGVLGLSSDQPAFFGEDSRHLIESAAATIAVAIANAQLYEQAQYEIAERKQAEKTLKHRNEELSALNEIATTISRSLDLDEVLNVTLKKVLDVMEVDGCWIQLLDKEKKRKKPPSLVAYRDLSLETNWEAEAIEVDPSLLDQVVQSGQPITAIEALEPPRVVPPFYLRQVPSKTKNLVYIPLKSKDKVLGVLGILSHRPSPFGFEEMQLLASIGHQIGVVIENVQLTKAAAEAEVLREVDRLRSELIANVSHELRTPLGLIKIFCSSLLMEDVDFDHGTQLKFLYGIEDETNKLEQIADNLLDLGRAESGRLRLDKYPADLGQLAREVMRAMKAQLSSPSPLLITGEEVQPPQYHFEYDFPSDPLMATADSKRIEQVLRNLLGNAVKYSPEGGTITLHGHREEEQVLIYVSDEGIGIPVEEHQKIFERFYRVENELTRRVRGAGLGLPVCWEIVKAHGGRIWVESSPGAGSTFCFTLPLSEDQI